MLFLLCCSQFLKGQCTQTTNPCGATCSGMVINEVSGDSGQSDAASDAIVEFAGPDGTDISGYVVTNTEWAVVLPPGSTLVDTDGDGIGEFVLMCEVSNTVSTSTTNVSGTTCPDCDFAGMDLQEYDPVADALDGSGNTNGFNVCNDDANGIYVSNNIQTNTIGGKPYSFTLDNGSCGVSLDGDEVILFQPGGCIQDAVYWGGPDTTPGGVPTIGGSSGACGSAADHVAVSTGNYYTLGDNDDNGIVNDYLGSHIGFKADGTDATGVNEMPSGGAFMSDQVCYTIPPLSDDVWVYAGFAPTGCNSSYIRITGSTGSQDQGSGAQNPSHIDDPELNPAWMDNATQTGSGCAGGQAAAAPEWGYTDHPTPGVSNDANVWDYFYCFDAGNDNDLTGPDDIPLTLHQPIQ